VPEKIGPYELRAQLARDSVATIWSAWVPESQEELVLLEVLLPTRTPLEALGDYATEFRWQGLAAARLFHPGIVTLRRTEVWDERPIQVLDPVPGETLRDHLRQGPLTPAVATRVAESLLEALAYAHERDVMHGSVRPEVVFLDEKGQARLAGFGVPYVGANASLARLGVIRGIAGYLAPEQIMGEAVDGRADLFAVGVLLYEMLTGRHPFGAASGSLPNGVLYRTVYHRPPPLAGETGAGLRREAAAASGSDAFAALQLILDKALARNPRDRCQNAAEFLVVLRERQVGVQEAFISRTGQEAGSASQSSESARVKSTPAAHTEGESGVARRRWALWAVVAVVLLAVLGVISGLVLVKGSGSGEVAPADQSHSSMVAASASTLPAPAPAPSQTTAVAGSSTSVPASSSTLTTVLGKATASVKLDSLTFTYNGRAQEVSAVTDPPGLKFVMTYSQEGRSIDVPVDAGVYDVLAVVDDPLYEGSATGVLTIAKADPLISVYGWTGVYTGTSHGATGTARGVRGEDLSERLVLGARFVNVPGGRAYWSYLGGRNYNSASGSVDIIITPRPVTVRADDKTKYEGQSDPLLTYSVVSGSLVGSDRLSGTLTRDPGESPGTYVIRRGTLGLGANYSLSFQAGILTILPTTTTTQPPTTTTTEPPPTTTDTT